MIKNSKHFLFRSFILIFSYSVADFKGRRTTFFSDLGFIVFGEILGKYLACLKEYDEKDASK